MDNPEGSGNKIHDESASAPILTPAPVEAGRRTQLPTEPEIERPAPVSAAPHVGAAPSPPEPGDEGLRPSVLEALRQSRTTWLEVGKVAERLSRVGLGSAHARAVVRQAVLSFALGLTLVLMVAVVFAGGTLRLVLGILAGTFATALVVFGALRGVSKLAERRGARTLPGSPWLWVGGVVVLAAAGTLTAGLSLWEVGKVAVARRTALVKPSTSADTDRPSKRADSTMKRGVHIGLERGVLYAPPQFASADGQFDLIIHFHGNTDLVEQSLVATKLNALIAIVNVGDGAGVYSRAMQNPYAFDRMLTVIEHRAESQLHLKRPQIQRIALSAWSAGFASVGQILSSRSRLDRVDAVLLEDSPHAKFAPFAEPEVYVPSLQNYLAFARRAMAGRKLMVITHSAIPTEGYPSTTQTVDALLKELGLERTSVAPAGASPPPVDIPVAKRAFPDGERNWLQVVSEVHKESFHVYGCTGNQKGDHIAHLAQMSVSVLPLLKERWQ